MAFPPSPAHRLAQMQSQHDEGYSEETQSLAGDDVDIARSSKPLSETAQALVHSLDALSQEDRLSILKYTTQSLSTEQQISFFKDIVFNLPTWAKQSVSSHLDSLMFFDPVRYFPYEIVQNIMSHLNPKELLSASAVSHDWREHTQDEELWRACFRREGWKIDAGKIRNVELSGSHHAQSFVRRDSRKKRRLGSESRRSAVHIDETVETADSDAMEGIESTTLQHNDPSHRQGLAGRPMSVESMASEANAVMDSTFRLKPAIFQSRMGSGSDVPRVSWAWLYKHRRQLERNWEQGNYQMFRLPHPKYEMEGHAECVYTIQHVGNLLVSGSRDRTIRRWDLDTCRLRGPPLHGHEASVLCLQFDPAPEHDIIVSGGSDSWVIIWRFSTGEILKKMTTAHTESVLNLRFDDRYIVTCSKDKTIKIWNRRAILLNDPIVPQHVLPQHGNASADTLIQEFSLLTKLQGHKAAVNAVMIHGDRIVSASGDREIKAWNIHSGRCEKTYTGHSKGIACVQYDGRRIISGSSDNTVRIFDAEQQAEVACLHGHSNLVRTVQARFGDLEVTTEQELHDAARKADTQWLKAMAAGVQPASGSRHGRRNAGSSRPEDMLSVGAKVPPGGGGTRWARIVSGSYDETVIIWRKDHDGKWIARHKLHQDMLGRHRIRVNRPPVPQGQVVPGAFPPQDVLNAAVPALQHTTSSMHVSPRRSPSVQSLAPSEAPVRDSQVPEQSPITMPSSTRTETTQPTNVSPRTTALAQPAPRPTTQSQQATTMQAAQRESNRVFKLQFDARRIVCCSQNNIIVGWDFAAGNEDLARVGSWCDETY